MAPTHDERIQKYAEAVRVGWSAEVTDWVDVAARAVMDVADAEQAELRTEARALAGFARYHAMHVGVSKGDRARIAELCDLIEGCDGHLSSDRIRAACNDEAGR